MIALFITMWLAGQDFGLDPHLFQHPIDDASAVDVKGDTLFSISYGTVPPTRVCIGRYDDGDSDYLTPLEQQCFVPELTQKVSLYVWLGKNLQDLGNVMVTISHAKSAPTVMVLTYKES